MEADREQRLSEPRLPWLSERQDSAPGGATADDAVRLSALDQESLVFNLEASLDVRARHQFFGWTQGALQSLLEHDLLVCALRDDGSALLCVDSFSTAPVEPTYFNELFRQDVSLVPHILKTWEDNRCQPVEYDLRSGSPLAAGTLARELLRLGASTIVAHGTHDATGQLRSFFTFARRPDAGGPRQVYLADLVVPFLHAAWMRTRVNWLAKNPGAKQVETGLVTSREREVLEWMYRGKSNNEIGMILSISPLTVKQHVQKILRKLDVLTRTQAVGKALALQILSI